MYDPQILYWLGIWSGTYMAVAPLAVLWLVVDRCISLKFYGYYKNGRQTEFVLLGTVTMVALSLASTWMYLLELPLDMSKVTRCETMACTMRKSRSLHQLLCKDILATANILCSLLFFYFVRQNGQSNSAKIIKNRVVRNTIIFAVVFDIIPGYFAYGFSLITGESSANYLGQYTVFLCTFDAALCAIFYSHVMLRRRNANQKISQVHDASVAAVSSYPTRITNRTKYPGSFM
ncbi:hypothetical protein DdX_19624 [Ditylenchus destructor]|uniref:Uncharacterized protein n=1 Tax=Ditylenchus destructor TaxID=166010 RepID=A0AAD4MII5_9BILA|nr:hypothetical protein DdX_19624 [Ditylenchus destructor]